MISLPGLVSAGKWNDWIRAAGWLVQDGPLLDMGCGKGILLEQALERGFSAVGLDESKQMLKYSRKYLPADTCQLIRGVGQTCSGKDWHIPDDYRDFSCTVYFRNRDLE